LVSARRSLDVSVMADAAPSRWQCSTGRADWLAGLLWNRPGRPD